MTENPPCDSCGRLHVNRFGGPACVGHCTGIAHRERAGEPCGLPPMPVRRCAAPTAAGPERRRKAAQRMAIVTWIERTYHRRRRQRALGKLTPIEYELLHHQLATAA